MSDVTPTALDGENPVNPYSLLEAVNDASETVHTGWLIFLLVMSYLLITAAGVTHRDLLLNQEIPLPILQVRIDLARFFIFAPIILVIFHMGVIAQMVILARKALEFDSAIRLLEPTDKRTHPLRLEANNFFFVQGLAGPERSKIMGAFLHGMSWLTLVFLPVLILLYMQIVFLPFHNLTITVAHRAMIFIDMAMLVVIGAFLARPENSFRSAFGRTLRQHPTTAVVTSAIFAIVTLFSLFVATIPGEPLDRMTDQIRGRSTPEPDGSRIDQAGLFGFSVPFLKPAEDGSLFGLFYRNLVVTDTDLVQDNVVADGDASWNLRGRDLRYARLDRSDLHKIDFTGADLEGASFTNADMREVRMGCVELDKLLLNDDRRDARCTDARGANFTNAKLPKAYMAGVDLSGATLTNATLDGANLSYAILSGADMASAKVRRADMTGGVLLYGANLAAANFQGTDMTGARPILADLRFADLQGTILTHARLEKAKLDGADLTAADLRNTRLASADFSAARVTAADFRGAILWATRPPEVDALGLVDASLLTARVPDQLDISSLRDIVDKIPLQRLKARMSEGLADMMAGRDAATWAASDEAQVWARLQAASIGAADGYGARLTESLGRLACRAQWANGAVAVGIARRAMTDGFRGDIAAVNARLRSPDCPAGRNIAPAFLADFGTAADIARGQ